MAFRFVRFVSFRFISFVFVPSATAFPGSQSTITHLDDVYDKMGRKRLKKLLFLAVLYRRRGRRLCTSNRRFWVCQIFTKRREQGEFHNLIQEMRLVDPESHFRYLRMSKYTFDDLLRKVVFKFYIIYNHFVSNIHQVAPMLKHRTCDSTIRAKISPTERLAMTLRFLATGNSQVFFT